MTELQLLCSPFRVVEVTIQSCCAEPLSASVSAELQRITETGEQAYLTTLRKLSEELGSDGDAIDYRVVLSALHINLSNDFYYGALSNLLPTEVIACLQGKLPAFPPDGPAIDWDKLLNTFIQFHPFASEYARIDGYDLGLVDTYISCAFTSILQHLINGNLAYDAVAVDRNLEWVLEKVANDKHFFLNVFDNTLIEKGDLEQAMNVRHNLKGVIRQLENYPNSSLVPDWIRQRSAEEVITSAKKKIESIKDIESIITEKQTYGPPPNTATNQPPIAKNPTQAALAMYYYYCHETQSLPSFPSGMMEQAYKDAVAHYGLSWKAFQQHYNRLRGRKTRLAPENREALLDAIKMLQTYPKALQFAEDELKTAETRKPLT